MQRLAVLLLASALAQAPEVPRSFHPSPNPVSDFVREVLERDSKNLVGSAVLLPADKYLYHPTPAQMTFGQLVAHVAQTNVALCSGISGMQPPLGPDELARLSGTDSKDSLVDVMKRSFDFCAEGLAKVNDSHLAEQVTIFGHPTALSRGAVMITIARDWADHYATAASYLRMNGVLPPSAPRPNDTAR
jgi:hypothetical protein